MKTLFFLLFVFIGISAQDNEHSYMKAIDRCDILVEDLNEPAKNLGITKNVIQAEVLKMFNDVGIEHELSSDIPTLYISLGSFYVSDSSSIVYHISVELFDYITYKDDFTWATIWDKNYTGIVGRKVDKSEILNDLKKLLDLFKADYIVGSSRYGY